MQQGSQWVTIASLTLVAFGAVYGVKTRRNRGMDKDALTETDDPVGVWRWRFNWAKSLSYQPAECWIIANNHDIDLHTLDDLIERGCDRHTALRILG